MKGNGPEICDFLSAYADFNFTWNTKENIWELFDEKNQKIGYFQFEHSSELSHKEAVRMYKLKTSGEYTFA